MPDPLYPVALKLDGRRVVVVGGGKVAARKVKELLNAGGEVEVIAPHSGGTITQMAADGRVRWTRRRFQSADLDGAWLVVAATDNANVNTTVWQAARERKIWVNVVDDPPHCGFYAPAVIRRGPVTVAINTGGISPALAAWLRAHLEKHLPEQLGPLATLLGQFRLHAQQLLPEPQQRAAFWEQMIATDLVALATSSGLEVVQATLEKELSQWLDQAQP